MLPLIGIAASIIPEIIHLIAGDKIGNLATNVVHAVQVATGTSDPSVAQAAIASDVKVAADLKERLAQIAVDAAKTQNAEADTKRQAELDSLKAKFADTQSARTTMLGLAQSGSRIAWGAPIVSVIVTVGFFLLLCLLLLKPVTIADSNVAQLLNLAVGALLAGFSQVISYWIGSSAGSRSKDDTIGSITKTALTPLPAARSPAVMTSHPSTNSISDNFARCLPITIAQEGGYVDDSADPGGATKYGITSATLAAWRGVPSVTAAEVQALTQGEAGEIYRALFWLPMACPQLPDGVDLMVFDFGVNAGPKTAVKSLQKVLGVTADGSPGPITLGAVDKWDGHNLITSLADARRAHYRSLPGYEKFGRGWEARVENVAAAAISMSSSPRAAVA